MIALALSAWLAVAQEPSTPPHVVVVVWDATRPDHLGPYGYERDTTPNLSAWASSAAVFEHAQTTAPWSAPAMAGIFTGLFTHNHLVDWEPGGSAYSVRPGLTTMAEAMHDAGYTTALFTSQGSYLKVDGTTQGFDQSQLLAPEAVLSSGLNFLNNSPQQPHFVVLHWQDPHPPYEPSPTHSLWSDPGQPFVQLGLRKDAGWHRPNLVNTGADTLSPAQMAQLTAQYDGELHANDAEFGQLLTELNARGLTGNTVVVFTSTHGEGLGEHSRQMVWHDLAYDTILNVPLIISGPGITPGRVGTRVRNIDIYPTVLDLVGKQPAHPLNGESLLPLLSAPGADRVNLGSNRFMGGLVFYSDAQTKLFFSRTGTANLELYDHENDPFEQENLGADADRLKRAQGAYETALKRSTLALPR